MGQWLRAARCAGVLFVAAAAVLGTRAAHAQPVDVAVRAGDGFTRMIFTWPGDGGAPLQAAASVENGVLVARFTRPLSVDADALRAAAADRVAMARLDPDQRTLRLALRGPARGAASTSYNMAAVDIIAPARERDPPRIISPREQAAIEAEQRRQRAAQDAEEAARKAAAPPPALPLKVTFAEASEYARIMFHWTTPVDHTLEVLDGVAWLRFARDAAPDLGPLNAAPPRGVESVTAERADGRLMLRFELTPGFQMRSWRDDPRVVADLIPADAASAPGGVQVPDALLAPADTPAPEPAGAAQAEMAPAMARPAPRFDPDTVIRARAARAPGGVEIAFAWPEAVAAAAFRRGDALWVVFDAAANVEVGELRRAGGRLVRSVQVARGVDHVAVRLGVADTAQIAVREHGARWVFAVTEVVEAPAQLMDVRAVAGDGRPGRLMINAPADHVVWVEDPVVGDRLLVAPAMGPAAALPAQRRFLELTVLASAHGVAMETVADDLIAETGGGELQVSRPGGLALSPVRREAGAAAGLRLATATPGFIDFAGLSVPGTEFPLALNALSVEAAKADNGAEARLKLAQFLLAHELAAEALGVLAELARADPVYINDPRFRAARGVANLLMGRREEARRDLTVSALSADAATALWRGYLAAERRDWREARREFQTGEEAMFLYDSEWRARFKVRAARAALELGDYAAAKTTVDEVLASEVSRPVRMQARLVLADYFEGLTDAPQAIAMNRVVADSRYEPGEVVALFNITRLERALDEQSAEDAAEALERLRLRWRGDDTEIDITHELARIYKQAGRFRDGLALMRAAVKRFPDHPAVREISVDMADTFRGLFLDTDTTGFDPVEALALWYEFRDLTPVGPDGDRMIRRLVDRLVDFDLLPQAAELLEHQVENRLQGVSRAVIGTDLAAIYLMDRNPEAALRTIARTRLARLPETVNRERRLLQARALSELGRYEHALELLSTDRSDAAARERADIAWRRKNWALAGPLIADSLNEAWRFPGPLSEEMETRVIKAAIAMTLAGDEARLRPFTEQYQAKMATGRQAASWAIITDDIQTDGVRLRDLARRIASEDSLQAFIEDFRARRADTPAVAG